MWAHLDPPALMRGLGGIGRDCVSIISVNKSRSGASGPGRLPQFVWSQSKRAIGFSPGPKPFLLQYVKKRTIQKQNNLSFFTVRRTSMVIIVVLL